MENLSKYFKNEIDLIGFIVCQCNPFSKLQTIFNYVVFCELSFHWKYERTNEIGIYCAIYYRSCCYLFINHYKWKWQWIILSFMLFCISIFITLHSHAIRLNRNFHKRSSWNNFRLSFDQCALIRDTTTLHLEGKKIRFFCSSFSVRFITNHFGH